MPTETFFHLPEAKRERLVAAIRGELARVPFPELSINRIVHAAGIPRGSYYQYFRGKDDLYDYLLSNYRARMQACAREALLEQNGDVFLTMLAGFDESVLFAETEPNLTMLQHLFEYRSPREILAGKPSCAYPSILTENLTLIDASRLRCENREDLLDILEILLAQLGFALAELFCNPSCAPLLRLRFQRKLELLKAGLLRESCPAGRN